MGTNTSLSTAQGYLKLLMRKHDPHGNRNVSRVKHWPKPPKTKKYKSTTESKKERIFQNRRRYMQIAWCINECKAKTGIKEATWHEFTIEVVFCRVRVAR